LPAPQELLELGACDWHEKLLDQMTDRAGEWAMTRRGGVLHASWLTLPPRLLAPQHRMQPVLPPVSFLFHRFCFSSPLFHLVQLCLVPTYSSLFIDNLSNMIVHPEMLATTASLLLPTASSSVAPIPTVVPGSTPIYETAGDVGNRTLWYAASRDSPSSAC
jgi:hypothetical protein